MKEASVKKIKKEKEDIGPNGNFRTEKYYNQS